MIVCAAACPSVDKLFVTDRLHTGAVHRPVDFLQLPGGKAVNVARAVTTLGGEAEIVGLIGGHAGRWFAAALEAEGIPARFASSRGETRACLSVFDRQRGDLTEFYESCQPIALEEWRAFVAAVIAAFTGAQWLAIAGALPPGAPDDGFAQLVAAARASGVRSAVDARGAALEQVLAERPELIKVNAAEAGEFLGAEVADLRGALEAAQALRNPGGTEGDRIAIVTRGREGAVMVGPDQRAWSGRVAAAGSYPVGSGDAFLAGLLLARQREQSWPEAFAAALACATANAEAPGGGRLDAARAVELRAAVELTAIEMG